MSPVMSPNSLQHPFLLDMEAIHARSVERPHNFGFKLPSSYHSRVHVHWCPWFSLSGHRRTVTAKRNCHIVQLMQGLQFLQCLHVNSGILDLQTPEIMAWACRSAPVLHPHANETRGSHDLSRTFWHPNNEGHCKGQESGLLNSFPSDLVNFVHSMYILNHSDLFLTYRISFCIQVTSWIITNISSVSGKFAFCPTVPSGTKCFDAF